MQPLPLKPSQLIGPVLITILAVLAYCFDGVINNWLVFDRSLVESGQIWRLLSANFMHTNAYHLLLNLGGLWLLWLLHGDDYRYRTYFIIVIFCSVGVSAGIYQFSPELDRYVGLSGSLHGLFFLGIFYDMQKKWLSGWLLLIGGVAKILYEQFGPENTELEGLINAKVAVDAHLYGALSAVLIFMFAILGKKNPP